MSDSTAYPSLTKSDEELLNDLFALLTERVHGNPYSEDGSYAAEICALPVGLCAMAATHHLDVSLTLDDVGWHFLNFGEPNLVRATESGLRELGLFNIADWFAEAQGIVRPFLLAFEQGQFASQVASGISPGDIYYAWLAQTGHAARIDELSACAREQDSPDTCLNGSAIYTAWVRYARANPANVFRDPFSR